MPWIGSILPASVIGAGDVERRVKRQRDDRREAAEAGAFERVLDKAELTVEQVEKAAPVEDVQQAVSEEGHEDHERNIALPPPPGPGRKRIDLEG